jgi:hypothetical protein
MTRSIYERVTDVDSAKIFAAIELSKASWLVALHLPSHDKISVFQVPGGDVDRLFAIRERARETAKARSVLPTVEIHTCYEAGYDGFWLHRLLASGLTRWFHARVGDAKGRVRRIAIVALARKLIVALWRFVDTGLVPDGAIVKG